MQKIKILFNVKIMDIHKMNPINIIDEILIIDENNNSFHFEKKNMPGFTTNKIPASPEKLTDLVLMEFYVDAMLELGYFKEKRENLIYEFMETLEFHDMNVCLTTDEEIGIGIHRITGVCFYEIIKGKIAVWYIHAIDDKIWKFLRNHDLTVILIPQSKKHDEEYAEQEYEPQFSLETYDNYVLSK